MKRTTNTLEDFICAFSFQQKHYFEKPILLACGHVACHQCVKDLKNNTGLKKINCLKCNKENSLETEYVESDVIKNYMNLCSDKIMESLKLEFEETLTKAKSKINLNKINFIMYKY